MHGCSFYRRPGCHLLIGSFTVYHCKKKIPTSTPLSLMASKVRCERLEVEKTLEREHRPPPSRSFPPMSGVPSNNFYIYFDLHQILTHLIVFYLHQWIHRSRKHPLTLWKYTDQLLTIFSTSPHGGFLLPTIEDTTHLFATIQQTQLQFGFENPQVT